MSREPHLEIHSNKIYSKNANISLVIEFEIFFEIFPFETYIKMLVKALVNLIVWMES